MQRNPQTHNVSLSRSILVLATLCATQLTQADLDELPPVTETVYEFTTIDIPGAVSFTPVKANNKGLVTGSYLDQAGLVHGFVWENGNVQVIDAPGQDFTALNGVNDHRIAAGWYAGDAGQHAALFRVQDQSWTPLPDIAGWPNTSAAEVNNRGLVLGQASQDGGFNTSGWLWDGSAYTFFTVPGASSDPWEGTSPSGINELGHVTGIYFDAEEHLIHGFLRKDSTITTFDVPGADLTLPTSINNRGDIAGFYYRFETETNPVIIEGFILSQGRFVTVKVPGANGGGMSTINDHGVISGLYLDAGGVFHGFIGVPRKR